jgi:hypothetical protein
MKIQGKPGQGFEKLGLGNSISLGESTGAVFAYGNVTPRQPFIVSSWRMAGG